MDEEILFSIAAPLLDWYDGQRRILPWREDPTAYHVWISEIMLQQTRVEAVKPYYERFLSRLPDVESLAAAQDETLLKLWEGLGYYNRVRNLKKAAVTIVEKYQGVIPDEYEKLLELSGIGSYTAGAVASIGYGKKEPAVDGNVLRVLSRLRMDERCISDAKVKREIERELKEAMPDERPGDFNQAMMEIGACVCVPGGAPKCGTCPLAHLCLAHRAGQETGYPVKESKKARTIEEKTVLLLRDSDRVAIRKRPGSGLLAGMYEFPTLKGFCTDAEVKRYLEQNGMRVIRIQQLEAAKHIFSHREWHMRGFMIRVDELAPYEPTEETRGWVFIRPEETRERYPIPAAYAAYSRQLRMKLGKENFE